MSTLQSFNPATGEPVGSVPETTPAEVTAVVAKARRAQQAWGALSLLESAARAKQSK